MACKDCNLQFGDGVLQRCVHILYVLAQEATCFGSCWFFTSQAVSHAPMRKMVLLPAERIQAEKDALEAENAKLLAGADGAGASAARSAAASPSPSGARDHHSGATRQDPKRAASHQEATAGASRKDMESADKKAITEQRLRELAASAFRKRARSAERNERDPSEHGDDCAPARKERRRVSRSPSQPRSRERYRYGYGASPHLF